MGFLFCEHCGERNADTSAFCAFCGHPMNGAVPAQQIPASQIPRQQVPASQMPRQQVPASQMPRQQVPNPQAVYPQQPCTAYRTPPARKSRAGLWIGLGAAGVVLIAAAVVLILNWNAWFGGADSSVAALSGSTLPTMSGETLPSAPSQESGAAVLAPTEQPDGLVPTSGTDAAASEAPAESTESPTEAPTDSAAAKLSVAEAQALVEQQYRCTAQLESQTVDRYCFFCYRNGNTNTRWGEVAVDPGTGAITVLSGMRDSTLTGVDPDAVDQIVRSVDTSVNYSLSVLDLSSGEIVGSNNRVSAMSSSVMIDIPILYAITKMVERGTLSLDDTATVHITTSGRGELTKNDEGRALKIRELVAIMFRSSDNNATNSLMDRLSIDEINRICRDGGYTSVKVAAHIGATTDYTDNDNYVSSADLCGMLAELYDSSVLDRNFLTDHLGISDGSEAAGLLRDVSQSRIISFNGFKTEKYNEIALLEKGTQRYILVFMSNNAKLDTLKEIAALVGSYLYGCVE